VANNGLVAHGLHLHDVETEIGAGPDHGVADDNSFFHYAEANKTVRAMQPSPLDPLPRNMTFDPAPPAPPVKDAGGTDRSWMRWPCFTGTYYQEGESAHCHYRTQALLAFRYSPGPTREGYSGR
jgi:hypothetical protein